MAQSTLNRNLEIRTIHRRFAEFYKIAGGILLVLIGVWIGAFMFGDGYSTNVYTEMLSIFVTILVIDRLNEWRGTQQLKRRLIREAGSRDNSTALNAIDWLRSEDWLTLYVDNPLLIQQKLSRANLDNAYLYQANLEDANLYKANLSYADLSKANMKDTFLHRATLDNTSLFDTDFRQAVLWNASLRGAKYIETARFDEQTALPDAMPRKDENGRNVMNDAGRFVFDKYWTPDIDMTRYTNPEHPDFWQPEWIYHKDIMGLSNS